MSKKIRRLEDVLNEVSRRAALTGRTFDQILDDMEPFMLHPDDSPEVLREGLVRLVGDRLQAQREQEAEKTRSADLSAEKVRTADLPAEKIKPSGRG